MVTLQQSCADDGIIGVTSAVCERGRVFFAIMQSASVLNANETT